MSFWKSYLNDNTIYCGTYQKVNDLIDEYYNSMTNNPQKVIDYYASDAKITFNKQNMCGFYNLLNYISSKNISTLEYCIKEPIYQHLDYNRVLINVKGEIKATMTTYSWFIEDFYDIFVIEYRNGRYLITNHIFTPIPPN